jgi:hypothetical protein
MTDSVDIESTGGVIRCRQESDLAAPHIRDGSIPSPLCHIRVKGRGGVPLFLKSKGQAVGAALGSGKDDCSRNGRVGTEPVQETVLVLLAVRKIEPLRDLVVSDFARLDLDAFRLFQVFPRELGGRVAHRRGKQKCLTLLRNGFGYKFHVPDKTHVEHAVRFVYNSTFAAVYSQP